MTYQNQQLQPYGQPAQQTAQPGLANGAIPGGQVSGPPGDLTGIMTGVTSGPSPTSGSSQANMSAIWNLIQNAIINPSQAGVAQQLQALMGQQGILGDQLGLQQGEAQSNYGFSMRDLGIQQGQLDIEQGALNRRLPYLSAQHGLSQQGFDEQLAQAQAGFDQSTRGLMSSQTARGAVGSVGHIQHEGDLKQQLAFQQQTIGRERAGENLSYNEQVASTQDSQKQLGLMSQRLGLSKDEIAYRLNDTMQQLGLNGLMSTESLLQQMGQVQAGAFSPISSILGMIYQMSGLNPNVLQGTGS